MPKKSTISKAFASVFGILTVSVIAGIITMVVVYKNQIETMNPTYRPELTTTTMPPPPVMRLPKTLVPEKYTVFLQPHLYTRIIEEVNVTSPNQTLLFTGNSTVSFHCVQNVRSIYLHSKDLTIEARRVMNKDTNEEIRISSWNVHEDETDFLEIQLDGDLEAGGNYSLFLGFSGAISDYLEALYVSTYVEGDTDAERFLATTQLEPTFARRLFPCFDEPDMKAVFEVTIIHRRDTIALGNTKSSVSNIIDEEWKYTTFFPTPKMSTYLLAFMVSEFERAKPIPNRVTIQTFARPEAVKAGHTKYADNITRYILSFYEKQFKIEYELNKLGPPCVTSLDQVAVPDLSFTAMENWGLITYQEGVLLYEEGVSSWLHKEAIATVIAHELAHQWFGNLVTMKWWNDIWLNEGFATYMSYFAVDHVEPSFKIKDMLIMNDLHSAFARDALISSHPLSMPPEEVQTSFEIFGLFDDISYAKGAMVLRMLADFVGENAFNNGMRNYLKTFKGGNTDSNDLWNSIEKRGEWILANVNCTGYYRVNYNPENWQRLLTQLETNRDQIPLMNRGQLIDDAFNLARAKQVDVTLALNSTRFLHEEREFLPWESAVRNLDYFIQMFDRSEVYGPMQVYLREQVKDLYNFFRNYTDSSTVPDDHSLQHNQITAIEVACSNGLPECIEMAEEKFADWMNSNSSTNRIHPNLRSVIYCEAVAAGGKKEWEFAWKMYQRSTDTSEKDQLRRALSCTKETWLLNRYLEYTLYPEKIRLMDVASTITYVAENRAGQALAWNFVRAHWDYINQGSGAWLIESVSSRFNTQFELEELERFAETYKMEDAFRVALQAIEQTRVNIQWVAENKDVVLQWFEAETADLE
ncbi:alanyl (membrane) aminopeptidase-like b [Xenentodon cancila]